jgi:hypothetical protein
MFGDDIFYGDYEEDYNPGYDDRDDIFDDYDGPDVDDLLPLPDLTDQMFDDIEDEMIDNEDDHFDFDFAHPGGNSALRAATRTNPRNKPCPTCKRPNRLTPKDVSLGYQCDQCADREERGGF